MNYVGFAAILLILALPIIGVIIGSIKFRIKPGARYGSVNLLTGVVTRRFWTKKGAVNYVLKPRKIGSLGSVRPYDLYARPAKLTQVDGEWHAEIYEFANGI